MNTSPSGATPTAPCPACDADLPPGSSICSACGADIAMVPEKRARIHWIQVLPVPLVIVLAIMLLVVATTRLRAVGPGPDTLTTVGWLLLGDGERRPTLATLARAYETSRAMMRCCLDINEPCPVPADDWKELSGYANAAWRGYVPLVQWAAPYHRIEGRLAEMLDVDGRDGWGRPWQAELTEVSAGPQPGFYPDSVAAGPTLRPDLPLLRFDLRSAGADGRHDTPDDIHFAAVFPKPGPLYGSADGLSQRRNEIDRAQVWMRWQGTSYDLIDARVLAEWYLEN